MHYISFDEVFNLIQYTLHYLVRPSHIIFTLRMTLVYLSCQISGIHWWYKTASHAAELTCGYYNTSYRDGYPSIAQMLSKHKAEFNFTCVELLTSELSKYSPQAMADPEGLVRQVQSVNFTSAYHIFMIQIRGVKVFVMLFACF